MIYSNFHTHTTFSDGKNTPEEMAEKAKELSFCTLGFSDHSEKMDPDSIFHTKGNLSRYREQILELAHKNEGEIRILCGVEEDSYAPIDPELFDYVIGSVHFICAFDEYIPVDLSKEDLLFNIEKHFRGDPLELAKRYFDRLVTFAQRGSFQILGHFDLINKFSLFQEDDPEYGKLARESLSELCRIVPFIEVNTGAISRGYREIPYPAPAFLQNLAHFGGKVIVNSDAHNREGLNCFFDKVPKLLIEAGFTSRFEKTHCDFEEIPLSR